MNKFILFYSEQCQHSNEFIRMIQNTQLNELFVKISIHDKSITLPPKLTSVPTIIVPNINRPLTGNDVFSWLNQNISQFIKPQRIHQQLNQRQQQQQHPQQYQQQQQQHPQQYQQQPREPSQMSFQEQMEMQRQEHHMKMMQQRQQQPQQQSQQNTQRQSQQPPEPESTGPAPIFTGEMNSKFSDNYSFLDSDNPLTHSYSFLDNNMTNEITNHLKQQQQQQPQQNSRQTQQQIQQNNMMDQFMQNRDNDPYIMKPIART